ncbi:hypothetical protein [Evansella clarkii]|uniref:hypothetical protein n=1 Tax=Evansella clarkii TaxID=79879 RepID=UPI000B43E07C|nr:hypothetical protein [Evansella clarkii]
MKYIMNIWDETMNKSRGLWIDRGKVRYAEFPVSPAGIFKMNTKEFNVFPGKITLDTQAAEQFSAGNGISYIKQKLLHGFTTLIHAVNIEYESESDDCLQNTRHKLSDCPVDYIQAVKLPLARMSESWMRSLRQQSVPIVIFYAESAYEIAAAPWQRFAEAMFPKRMMLICKPLEKVTDMKEKAKIYASWKHIVDVFKFNSYYSFPDPGIPVSPFLAKRTGLFPKKGSLVMGSDADYLMYSSSAEQAAQPFKVPDIIVLKGKIVKTGTKWKLSNTKGKELTNLIPEKFLPIQEIYKYED